MRDIFLLFTFLFSLSIAAQVGIGTTNPDPSSILDISSTNKGLLIPRVQLTNTTTKNPVSNAVESILVYNTNNVGDVKKGFYYWTGSEWKTLTPAEGGGGSEGWNLEGNSVGNNDFLGTTNDKPLVIKTHNINRTRITTKGQIEVLNTGNSIFLGQENGLNDDLNNRTNIFIGYQSGKNNRGSNNIIIGELGLSEDRGATSNIGIGKNALKMNGGSNNIAFGELALSSNQNASSNIAIGKQAGQQNSGSNNIILGELALSENRGSSSNIVIGREAAKQNSGTNNIVLGELALRGDRGASSNIVIGKKAGEMNSGSKNIIIGENTLIADQGGSNNVLLGFEAGKILAGSNNTFLGYQAGSTAQYSISNSSAIGNGAIVTASNQIVLGNSAVTQVRAFGNLVVGGANPYILPNTRGNNGQVLKINGLGIVSWQPDLVASPRPENSATLEDIESLRALITEQQREINELKDMLQQVLSSERN